MGWLFGRHEEEKSSKVEDEIVEEKTGPWDFNDEDAPDFSDYLDFGSIYIPYFQGIELRVKKQHETSQVLGMTVTYGSSSVEVEAFAAPKTSGIWLEVCKDLLDGNSQACTVQGEFGTELLLPVKVGEKTITTRIVGVDGPRWMLRGVFSGPAATELADNNNETKQLDEWFKGIVVNRGEEPLAPRDFIPMHDPITREEKEAALNAENSGKDGENNTSDEDANNALKKDDKPLGYDQQVEVKTTLTRGPMFAEIR